MSYVAFSSGSASRQASESAWLACDWMGGGAARSATRALPPAAGPGAEVAATASGAGGAGEAAWAAAAGPAAGPEAAGAALSEVV